MTCPNCGADDSQVIPVWEDMKRHENGEQPKFLGCKSCHRLMRPDLLRNEDDDTLPQLELSEHEISRLPIGNQHSSDLSIIDWQCVKGAASYYGVQDWTSKVDSTLTKQENVSLMEAYGTENNRTTIRMMQDHL